MSSVSSDRKCGHCGALESDSVGVKFKQCSLCQKERLVASFYCSTECQKADWLPVHKPYHKAQKQFKILREQIEASSGFDAEKASEAIDAVEVTSKYDALVKEGAALAMKYKDKDALRKLERAVAIDPKRFNAYVVMANVYKNSNKIVQCAKTFEKVMECCKEGTAEWAKGVLGAFSAYSAMAASGASKEKPIWMVDEPMFRRISSLTVQALPNDGGAWSMLAAILAEKADVALKAQAVRCFERAAQLTGPPLAQVYLNCAQSVRDACQRQRSSSSSSGISSSSYSSAFGSLADELNLPAELRDALSLLQSSNE